MNPVVKIYLFVYLSHYTVQNMILRCLIRPVLSLQCESVKADYKLQVNWQGYDESFVACLYSRAKSPLGTRPFLILFQSKTQNWSGIHYSNFPKQLCLCPWIQFFDSWLSCIKLLNITFQVIRLKNFTTGNTFKTTFQKFGHHSLWQLCRGLL